MTDEDFEQHKEKYTPVFVRLLAFYISARYPEYKEKLTSTLTKAETKEILEKAKEVYAWVQSLRKFSK